MGVDEPQMLGGRGDWHDILLNRKVQAHGLSDTLDSQVGHEEGLVRIGLDDALNGDIPEARLIEQRPVGRARKKAGQAHAVEWAAGIVDAGDRAGV